MKKNLIWLAGIAVMLAACENDMSNELAVDNDKKAFTFTCQGDFTMTTESMTRGAMEADGKTMTDLWVLDYVGGTLVQQVHQASTDEDFGTPTLNLDYGSHHIYFVASRGTAPTLSTEEHTISWGTTSDTFYKDYSVAVTSGTASTQNVTLNRVATKLTITINDAIVDGTSYVEITPQTWYYGLDYLTGEPTAAQTSTPRTINIPSTKAGVTGMTLNIFGLSSATEWTTDVTVTACDGDDNTIGQASISNAPFKANRVTNYAGNLFTNTGGFALALSGEWDTEFAGSW